MQRLALRPTVVGSVLLVGALLGYSNAKAQDSSGTRAVPTYEAVGLYWSSPGASEASGCNVQFRKSGEGSWQQGLALWYDPASNECRGSLVNLTPGTAYEVQMGIGGAWLRSTTFSTWANGKPVARTINVPSGSSTLNVTEGGTASGYVVYDGGGSTLDAQNGPEYNVMITASYVIVRGLTLRGARTHGILISPNVHDVIIEDNEISGWGRTRDGTWGADLDSGIRAICSSPTMERVTIQRNRIHSPRYSANSWSDGHPAGPQAVSFSNCGGNHVIRHNEAYSTNGNYFNDVLGGEDNFTRVGFPNSDSDIYGNKLSHAWDDAIESEGANKNVRIWGNYIDRTALGVATTATAMGPVYVFRNVWNRSQMYAKISSLDQDDRQPFFKSGSSSSLGYGRRYFFHNTMLQATQSGLSYGLGGGFGMGGTGEGLIEKTISMNNIYHLWKPAKGAFYQSSGSSSSTSDMYNGSGGDMAMVSGINATPTYVSGHGWQNESGGHYALAAGTPGFDQATRIPNFNDRYVGSGPDVGAAEAGAEAMQFGLAAAGAVTPNAPAPAAALPMAMSNMAQRNSESVSRYAVITGHRNTMAGRAANATPPVAGPTLPAPAAPTTPPPFNGGGGVVGISATIDSSSYTVNVGDSVTFTVRLLPSGATPAGTVTFQSSSIEISNCVGLPISGGEVSCTTSALASGTFAISGVYSGDSYYSGGIAGPITMTVR